MNQNDLKKFFPNASASCLRANTGPDRVAPDAVHQPSDSHDEMGADAREVAYKSRCLVRLTSFRCSLCDERNLYDKHFVDALKEASAFVDDSPLYVEIVVSQIEVAHPHQERTVIVLSPLP